MTLVCQPIRDSARGQTCTVRLSGCASGTDTVVFAHLPVGQKGMGIKTPDLFGCYACANCHDAIDGRNGRKRPDAKELLRALAETQMRLVELGLLCVGRRPTTQRRGSVERPLKATGLSSSKILPRRA